MGRRRGAEGREGGGRTYAREVRGCLSSASYESHTTHNHKNRTPRTFCRYRRTKIVEKPYTEQYGLCCIDEVNVLYCIVLCA